jgi:hypothetical protein
MKAGLGITSILGVVSLILSYGLIVPPDLKSFSLVGAVAAMTGYSIGGELIKVQRWVRILLVAASAICCVG